MAQVDVFSKEVLAGTYEKRLVIVDSLVENPSLFFPNNTIVYNREDNFFYRVLAGSWVAVTVLAPLDPALIPFRGVAFRISSGAIDFTGVTVGNFINSGLTGTIDAVPAAGTGDPGAGKFGLKRTAEGKAWCQIIATADVAGTSNKRIGIKLALNGVPIDASECNITITPTTIGKLHTMYILELDEDDEVTVWFANKTNQQTITIERARITLINQS